MVRVARLRSWLSVVALVGLTLSACSRASFAAADEAAIRGLLERQAVAWNAGDLERFMTAYHRRPDIVFTSGGKVRRGYDASLAAYQKRYTGTDTKMGTLAFEDIDVTALGPDAGLAMGQFVLTDTPEAGRGIFSLVFTREGETWGIFHDHTSETPPEATP